MALITQEHVNNVCGVGTGAKTCSYIMMSSEGWECAKGTMVERAINERRETGTMNAMGNNCSGSPDFKPTD
jgi:hypothetical protein